MYKNQISSLAKRSSADVASIRLPVMSSSSTTMSMRTRSSTLSDSISTHGVSLKISSADTSCVPDGVLMGRFEDDPWDESFFQLTSRGGFDGLSPPGCAQAPPAWRRQRV